MSTLRFPETRLQSPDPSELVFVDFPTEIFEEVFTRLTVHDVLRMRQVCQKFRSLLTDHILELYARKRWGTSFDPIVHSSIIRFVIDPF